MKSSSPVVRSKRRKTRFLDVAHLVTVTGGESRITESHPQEVLDLKASGAAVLLGIVAIAGLGTACATEDVARVEQQASVEPELVEGNPTCADDYGLLELKVDPPVSDLYALPGGGSIDVTISPDGKVLTWTSTVGIDLVIVKGGDAAHVYTYDPPAESYGDDGLISPDNSSGGPAAISHVSFCYDLDLAIAKTANTEFTRTYSWDITKSAASAALLLAPGQTYLMPYHVVASVADVSDTDHRVWGSVSVSNPTPFTTEITSLTDTMFGDTDVPLDCGAITFPHVIEPGEEIICSYSVSLGGAIDGSNEAVVETNPDGPVDGNSVAVAVDFGAADITEIDPCVAVTDSLVGDLGVTCYNEAPEAYDYDYEIGPFYSPDGCGAHTVDNTATYYAASGATGEASWSVDIEVPCETGCTLTQGYWRTHSAYGPAPEDLNWLNLLPDGPDSPFFLSGQTYYEVLWTAPAGNVYYVLAHQYIAAELNGLNGADFTDAAAAFAAATALFETYEPADLAGLRGHGGRELKRQFVELGQTLDEYNNGLIGPGHCDE